MLMHGGEDSICISNCLCKGPVHKQLLMHGKMVDNFKNGRPFRKMVDQNINVYKQLLRGIARFPEMVDHFGNGLPFPFA